MSRTAPVTSSARLLEASGGVGWLLSATAIACLVWVFVARIAGPSDLWDQTQPKTVSYTTDIIVHGRWILPLERGVDPATKPPMYNWLAVPFVRWLGFASEIGHKFPSVLGLCVCWALVVRLGNGLDGQGIRMTGWMAGIALSANYAMFKLGYLARPDMVLVMWTSIGWAAVTTVFAGRVAGPAWSRSRERLCLLAFWLCTGLAGLTKGPAAVMLPVYAIVAGRILCGSWRPVVRLGWWWGLPLALSMVGAWAVAVWRIDPEHLYRELWFNEIWGRITGTGPEGNASGPIGWLTDSPNMAAYYVLRFGPWSLAALAAMVALWRRTSDGNRRWRSLRREQGVWLAGAALFAILTVGAFTLSTGKRADYIAPAIVPSALLAGWWLVREWRFAVRFRWSVPAAAAVVLTLLTIDNQAETAAPDPRFSGEIHGFIERAREHLEREPAALVFCWQGATHVQAMLGHSEPSGEPQFVRAVEAGRPFWLIAGRNSSEPPEFTEWVARQSLPARMTPVEQTARVSRRYAWPEQMTLYRVEPTGTGGS